MYHCVDDYNATGHDNSGNSHDGDSEDYYNV